jgi:flagellin
MTSILTNIAAMSALQTLRSIDNSLQETQARVASGLRVGGASDNAAYWSIATTMRSDNMALSAVQDAMGLGSAKADTAYAAMDSAVELVKEIKSKLVAAREPGVDKSKIQEEIEQLQLQLESVASSASFSGENWLQADLSGPGNSITKQIVGSFIRDSSGNVSVKTVDYTLDGTTVLYDTNGNRGIMDKHYTITDGPSITLDINTGGTVTKQTVKAYSVDEMITSGAIFNGTIALVTAVASGGADATGYYVRVSGDVWVQAGSHASNAYNGQEAAAHHTAAATTFNPASDAYYFVNTSAIPTSTTVTYSVTDLDIVPGGTPATDAQLDQMIRVVEAAFQDVSSAAASLGSMTMRLGLQENFIKALSDSIDAGIGRLVDADMNEESTRLKALQTQQQLAIQSLSIANTNSENILLLFR